MLILLSHRFFLRLSLALVAMVLKPNFHLKWARLKDQSIEHYTKLLIDVSVSKTRLTVTDNNQFPAHRRCRWTLLFRLPSTKPKVTTIIKYWLTTSKRLGMKSNLVLCVFAPVVGSLKLEVFLVALEGSNNANNILLFSVISKVGSNWFQFVVS